MDLQAAFAWYSAMARNQGCADYAIDQARELAKEHPVLFERLPAMLLKANPRLSQCRMERSHETRANTYRLQPERFAAPVVAVRTKGKRNAAH